MLFESNIFYKLSNEDCDEIKCGINKIMATIRDSTLEVLNNNSINNLSLKNLCQDKTNLALLLY